MPETAAAPPLPLELAYELTAADLASIDSPRWRGLAWVVGGFVALVIGAQLLSASHEPVLVQLLPIAALLTLFFFIFRSLAVGAPRRQFQSIAPARRQIRLRLEPDRLIESTPESSATTLWSAVEGVIRRPEALALQRGGGTVTLLPRRAFESDALFAGTAQWLATRVNAAPTPATKNQFARTLLFWVVLLALFALFYRLFGGSF